jgi:GNAT superfamily N-acetyltransferase
VPTVKRVNPADLDPHAVLDLYRSVGWSAYTDDPGMLWAAIAGSSTVVAAREGETLVGLARVISDNASICYLQDILVHPAHHRTGVGRALVVEALAPYTHVRQKVLLTDDEPRQKAFYESLGYTQSTEYTGGTLRGLRAVRRGPRAGRRILAPRGRGVVHPVQHALDNQEQRRTGQPDDHELGGKGGHLRGRQEKSGAHSRKASDRRVHCPG